MHMCVIFCIILCLQYIAEAEQCSVTYSVNRSSLPTPHLHRRLFSLPDPRCRLHLFTRLRGVGIRTLVLMQLHHIRRRAFPLLSCLSRSLANISFQCDFSIVSLLTSDYKDGALIGLFLSFVIHPVNDQHSTTIHLPLAYHLIVTLTYVVTTGP
jgi:hypothetical protein